MLSRTNYGAAKIAICMALLSLLGVVCGGDARCQNQAPPAPNPKELHGGIEVSLRSVRAIVLRVPTNAEGDNVPRILFSDQLNPSTPFPKDDKPTPEYVRDLAQTVQKLSERLQRELRVPPNQIHLLGLSDVAGQTRDDLARELQDRVGREIMFLDAKGETELNIAGNIPRQYQLEGKRYDNRSISLLLDITATNVRGGYQQLGLTSRGRAEYDYVTWDIPITTNGPLRAEATQNPGLMMRKKVYLMGNIVWALTALLYPQNQGDYAPLTIEDINGFYYRAMTDPEALLNPDLSKIRDENARKEARKGREAIKAIYTPRTLAAGAEALKTAATELNLADKQLIFARNSNWARLVNFVRLQIEQ
jgi:hypothetical protein